MRESIFGGYQLNWWKLGFKQISKGTTFYDVRVLNSKKKAIKIWKHKDKETSKQRKKTK